MAQQARGGLYDGIYIGGGNVHLGDRYLLDDDTFKSSTMKQQKASKQPNVPRAHQLIFLSSSQCP